MKKTLYRLAMLAIPVLAASCGLDEFINGTTDGGTASCGTGVTAFQIQTGSYMTQSALLINDGCQLGVTAQDFMTNRNVTNDAAGNITLSSADNSTILGTGAVRCNQGNLAQTTGISLTSDPCTYNQTSTVDMTVTSANTFNVTIVYNRTYMNSKAGMVCSKPTSCSVSFSATMKK